MSEEKEEDSVTVFITTITEYLMNKYEAVNTLQQSDFISFNRITSDLEETFGEFDKFIIIGELMKIWQYQEVYGMGNVWLIKAKV